jgi:transcription elongation GreA/GreB family factor
VHRSCSPTSARTRRVVVIGFSVLIEDLASGALSQYRLASAHQSLGRDPISVASPIGQALIGSVPGTTVTVELANGRSRSVRLVDVESEGPASQRPRAAA